MLEFASRARAPQALVLAVAAALLLPGCALGPDYRRPALVVPDTTRGQTAAPDDASLADLGWWEVFHDPKLKALLAEALASNHDLKAAAARVEQARQFVVVARADMLPQLGYDAGAARARSQANLYNPTSNFLATLNLAWEIDLWGRIRRSTEAAKADFYAAEDVRRGVLLTLVSDVATGYFELLDLYIELEITRQTADAFRSTLDLFNRRYEGGIGTLLEVSRARAALTQTEASIPDIERLIATQENRLSVLLGRPPGPVVCEKHMDGQVLPPTIPVGVPSQLLERRPDLLAAEQAVVRANAEVGVALAGFFPRIGLTTLYGGQSADLENIVRNSGNVWAAAGSLSGPLFQSGRLIAAYRASDAKLDEAVERYQQAVLQAFAEVASLLVTHEKLKGVRARREETVVQLQTSVALSLQRYTDGIASYFEVLEAQQQFFPAAITLVRTQRDELTTMVALYRALGGGWKFAGTEAEGKGEAEAGSLPNRGDAGGS